MHKFPFYNFYTIITFIISCIYVNLILCDSVRFNLPSGSTKCITEDIKTDSITVGKYTIVDPIEGRPLPESYRISARVTSTRGNNYYYEDVKERGSFGFTTTYTGDYMACFWGPYYNPPFNMSIDFEWKTGIDTKEWHNIARKGQLDLLDIELRRLYDIVRSIHDEMFYLREREEEMQELNRSTKSNMLTFSFVSIIIVVAVAALQLWHLKEYLEMKKVL